MATWWPNFFQDKNVFNGNFWQKCFSVEQIPQKLCGQNFPRKTLWSKCFWLPKEEEEKIHRNSVAKTFPGKVCGQNVFGCPTKMFSTATWLLDKNVFQGKLVAKMFLVARQKCFPGKVGGQRKSVGRGKRFGQQASKHQILLFGFGFRHISKYCTQASLIKDLSVFFPASR